MHWGVDYGSKLAGTTVIAYDRENELRLISAEKKKDADKFLISKAEILKPKEIYLDAPLSLPGAYFGYSDDFHYRKADKELRAMSPMFLGGLTARAISLKSSFKTLGIETFETYPGAFVRSDAELCKVYMKKDKACIPACLDILTQKLPIPISQAVSSIHELDSVIAWYSGYRHKLDLATIVGDESEGQIIF